MPCEEAARTCDDTDRSKQMPCGAPHVSETCAKTFGLEITSPRSSAEQLAQARVERRLRERSDVALHDDPAPVHEERRRHAQPSAELPEHPSRRIGRQWVAHPGLFD